MLSRLRRRVFFGRLIGAGLSIGGVLGLGRWLGGDALAGDPVPCVRPPGALREKDFLSACIRCSRCADACPNHCIAPFTKASGQEHGLAPGRGQRNTPVLFPRRQACVLCQGVPGDQLLCTEACPTGALQPIAKTLESIHDNVKMGVAEVDTNICYSYMGGACGVCIRACPLEGKALHAGMWETPIVDPDWCVGCGLCERACVRYPQAIRVTSAEVWKRSATEPPAPVFPLERNAILDGRNDAQRETQGP